MVNGIFCNNMFKTMPISDNIIEKGLSLMNTINDMKAANRGVEVTLEDGTKIKGTEEQVISIIKRLGYSQDIMDNCYYDSKSKGRILITDMDSQHIKNAYVREIRESLASYRFKDMTDFVEFASIFTGTEIETRTCSNLIEELERRLRDGEV